MLTIFRRQRYEKNPETPKESQEICVFMSICLCLSPSQPIGICGFGGLSMTGTSPLSRWCDDTVVSAQVHEGEEAEQAIVVGIEIAVVEGFVLRIP